MGQERPVKLVVVQSETLVVDDQPFRDRVEGLYEKIVALGPAKVQGGTHYYQDFYELLVSSDRHTTILPVVMAGKFNDATTNVKEILEMVREANGKAGFKVLMAGESSIAVESNEIDEEDTQ